MKYTGKTKARDVPTNGNEADILLYVLDGWMGTDDWGMPKFPYPATVRALLGDLRAGDDPRTLRWAAKQTGDPIAVAAMCPAHWAREKAAREAMATAGRARSAATLTCPACGFHRGYHSEDCDR